MKPLLICELMSSAEIRLHQIFIYTIRANHVLICLYFLDICCVNMVLESNVCRRTSPPWSENIIIFILSLEFRFDHGRK